MSACNQSDLDPRTQLIPHLIDHYAKVKPDAIYAEYPVNPMSYDAGYRPISYKSFANAINGLAQWLTENLGPGNGEEVLAFAGGNDLRYPALVLGAVKAGYCMFLPSPRNSVEAHRSLLQKLECKTLLTPVPRPPFIANILAAHPLKTLDLPSVDTLVETEYPHFAYSKKYPEDVNDRLVVLHTSGSTGIPKPIIWTLDSAVKHMHMQALKVPEGFEGQDQKNFGKRVFVTLPAFHAAGLSTILLITVPVNATAIMPTAAGLPTAASLVAARKQTQFDCALVVPSIVQDLAQDPQLLDYCSTHLEHIVYAGGDLPQSIGDIVAAKLRLMNGYGATEIGILNVVHSPGRDVLTDWRYLEFHPELGMEFRHISGQEYEAVLVRSPTRQAHQCPFVLFPDLQEYHTKDLMTPHPTKPNLWRPSARLDDVIVFLNGEKTNPISMEQYIVSANPDVTGCIVIGAQRFQAALLVELGEKALNVNDRAAMIEQLWPSIEQANAAAPAHARISKSHILFASSKKALCRASKGTVQRAQTVGLYAQEIQDLYNDAERLAELDATHNQLPCPGGLEDATQIAAYIRASILAIAKWSKLSDTDNWFNLGLDSLQAITATRVFKHGLNIPCLAPNTIYLNPTVLGLTQALQSLHQNIEASKESEKKMQMQERELLLQELIGQIDHTTQTLKLSEPSPVTQNVVLTGSTGQLGTYLLDCLLKNPVVEHVYCLNRNDSNRDRDRQRERGAAYGLAAADASRVTFWKADLSRIDLGLQPEQFQKLQQTATLVLHNAWAVNFNLSLASFKPQLVGVVNLINFTTQAAYSPPLFFVSSISSTMGRGHLDDAGLTPESLITTTTPAPNGYANSKYIAEHLLGYASQQGLARSAFVRVGQMAGSVQSPGLWSKSEWFPSMVLSSVYLGALPDSLGAMDQIDWLPIDLLAEVMVDLALLNSSSSELSVYHLLNLKPKTWQELQGVVADSLQKAFGNTLETIPLGEWVHRVQRDIELANEKEVQDEDELRDRLKKNPAAKLLMFFEEIGAGKMSENNALDTKATAQASEKLRKIDAVMPEWIQKWVQEWSAN